MRNKYFNSIFIAVACTLPLIPALFLVSCGFLPPQAVELVRDGRPLAEIVTPTNANPSVKAAGKELQKYLKKISGAELPIVNAPGTNAVPVFVGRSEHTDKLGIKLDDVRYDGFKIVVREGFVALLGVDDCRPPIPRNNTRFGLYHQLNREWEAYTGHKWEFPFITRDPRNFCPELGFHFQDANGTLYAVYEFLEMLGLRWFMPIEEIGQVIPESRTIAVTPVEIKKEPAFASRYLILCGMGKNPVEFLWYKYLKQGGTFDQWPAHSSTIVSKLQQDRPELLAYSGGSPISCGHDGIVPRLSSPQLRAELAEYLIKAHDTFPELPYLPVCQPDGWNTLDDRDVAAGWDKKEEGNEGRFADYTWDFVLDVTRQVSAKRPGVKFCTASYGYNKKPPKSVPEVPADIAMYLSQNSTMGPRFDDDLALRREWLAKAPKSDFFIYDYYLSHYPRRAMVPIPAIFTPLMARNFGEMTDRFVGILTELSWGTPAKNNNVLVGLPGINHLMIYLHARFTWDRNLDVQATLADYYEKFYGPAQKEMREFFEYAESVWMRPEPREITAFSGFLKPADVPKYFEILERAKKKAGDTIYGKRIDFITNEIAPLKNLFSELKRTGPYVRVIPMASATPVDGDLAKPFWTSNYPGEKVWLKDCITGVSPDINRTSAEFRWLPDNSLLVGITCYERRMDKLAAHTPATEKDRDTIWEDDTIELHLETPEGYRPVVAVNPNGAVHDRCATPNVADVPAAWSAEQVAVRKLADRWTVEIKVQGLGTMPNKSYPWGVNVFRLRRAGGESESYALSPTGTGAFLGAPGKMGNLYGR
ncbi:MAG: DUF4838 domain-containing protein, partial [Kiritimatiellia bacterium]